MPRPTKIRPISDGMIICCNIDGDDVKEAYVHKCENGIFYLLQNVSRGFSCGHKFGYRCSWEVGIGTKAELERYGVTDIYVLDNNPNLRLIV